MPVNALLLRQIADIIEAHPDSYDQGVWLCDDKGATSAVRNVPYVVPDKFTCTSRCCIAGWAVALTPEEQRPDVLFVSDAAEKLLGLGSSVSHALFHSEFQPLGMTVAQALRKIADTGKMLPADEYTLEPFDGDGRDVDEDDDGDSDLDDDDDESDGEG